jgi:hypothetical protein
MRQSIGVADATTKNRVERLHRFFEAMHKLSDHRAAKPEQKAIIESQVNPARFTEFIERFGSLSQQLLKAGECIDVWELSGLKRNEQRNVSVLAWLFSPNQTHGRGSNIFKAFLRRLTKHQETSRLPKEIIDSYSVVTENYPLGNVENRIDIVLTGADFFVFIEVKIDAAEGDRQTDRYCELAKAKANSLGTDKYDVIYLSPKREARENVIGATWKDVAGAIEDVAVDDDSFGDRILLQYARYISRF